MSKPRLKIDVPSSMEIELCGMQTISALARRIVARCTSLHDFPSESDVLAVVPVLANIYREGYSDAASDTLKELLDMLQDAKALLQFGTFKNGVTDATGTIDEGEMKAGEMIGNIGRVLMKYGRTA